MNGRFGFERLEVWQYAIELTSLVYQITRNFPGDERFGLTNQLRRSSNSVAANIAEGSGRGSTKDFKRFIGIAYGSLMEVVSHLHVAKIQQFITEEDFNRTINLCHSISKMLSGLKNSLKEK
ncbi:MAG TPA: four helix bundle protein [Planctomycetaceae bacterium]|uniref:four helix bundle protein n=1 Tax=Rubinisphaera sp. TaxID=2024857 RepID=UPI000C0EB014|nr:four helix bundle protein [Rubinisphaera sp.]MBV09327.1 four helix bundle protein [Rubinisphaera sp.]HBN78052.1 four helix bundle protein [Planctomycetaceae bacterium]HCS52105.1 four helix bundle protein [Planctomycetaceae bacterium]|tara:strand:- start:386 stop:751 length:366 start_codon:yes stop_codon:yes gene_type:complete